MVQYNGIELIYFLRTLPEESRENPLTTSELRKMVSMLFITEFGCLSVEQAKIIILLLGNKSYSPDSLRKLVSREYDESCFESFNSNGTRFIKMTGNGFLTLLNLLRRLFSYSTYNYEDCVDEVFLQTKATVPILPESLSTHNVLSNTTMIVTALTSPVMKEAPFLFRKEMNLTSWLQARPETSNMRGDVITDILFFPFSTSGPIMGLEVDLGTERVKGAGPNTLIGKVLAYSSLYNKGAVDLFLLLESPEDALVGNAASDLYGGYAAFHDCIRNRHFSSNYIALRLLLSAYITSVKNEGTEKTVAGFAEWIHFLSKIGELSQKEMQAALWYQALQLVKEYVTEDGIVCESPLETKEQGLLPAERLPEIVQRIKKEIGSRSSQVFPIVSSQAYNSRSESVYKAIVCDEDLSPELYRPAYGITAGMMLVCSRLSRIYDRMPYLYPGEFLSLSLPTVLHHMGLLKESYPIRVKPQTRPLVFGATNQMAQGTGAPLLFMRNAFRIGDMDVCIENISEDLGGLLRVQKYLKLPFGSRPGTILIALVDGTDFALANGKSLYSDSLYTQPVGAGKETAWIESGEFSYWPYMSERLQKFLQNNSLESTSASYLPLSLTESQDMVLLTYSEFEKALSSPVIPWMYDPEHKKRIPRKYIEPGHRIAPHAISMFANSFMPCSWEETK